MRKLCPNMDREDGLDTVLEVPVPDELFASRGNGRSAKFSCSKMRAWMRSQVDRCSLSSRCGAELQLMLGVVGAPLAPQPVEAHQSISSHGIKEDPLEVSMAKYIVQQYVAAAGGEKALRAVESMYAMGKVQMKATECQLGHHGSGGNKKGSRGGGGGGGGELGGFVLWQKSPELWSLELVVSGCKISAGSDGKLAWRQMPWQPPRASRGPPRLPRRCLQGLDPRSTAGLFSDAVWIGEKAVAGHDCFVLRLDAKPAALRARSSNSTETVRHTMWGYFSQRTGLLVQLEDTHLLRIQGPGQKSVYWETNMESLLEDYRAVDGISIAHCGRTRVSLFRFGDTNGGRTRSRMEETWNVEEVDFNIMGLSMDCFLPPRDLKEEKEKEGCDVAVKSARPPAGRVPAVAAWFGPSTKVVAVDSEDSDSSEGEDGKP